MRANRNLNSIINGSLISDRVTFGDLIILDNTTICGDVSFVGARFMEDIYSLIPPHRGKSGFQELRVLYVPYFCKYDLL